MTPRLLPHAPSALVIVAVGSAIAGLVLGMSWPGGPVVSTPTAVPGNSQVAIATDAPGTGPTPPPVRSTPSPRPSGSLRQDACELPEALPPADPPAGTPAVEADDVAMVFTSYLYERSTDGSIVATDHPDFRWQVGLWHVAPGFDAPRLLLAPPGGAVLPLAISADGEAAVVWWLPERRGLAERTCISGIYVLSLVDGASQLITGGDWSLEDVESRDPNIEPTWSDPRTNRGIPRDYRVPTAFFSANSRFVAIIDGLETRLYRRGEDRPQRTHVGACGSWAWAPTGATFVTGCEDTTSAWLVVAQGGYAPESYALPLPRDPDLPRGWLSHGPHPIGLTREGDVRVARFYGFPIGCESACVIPPPAWAVTTLDPGTMTSAVRSGRTDFMAGGGKRMAPDATWVYVELYHDGEQRTLDLETGQVRRVKLLGEPAGQAIAGSLLFGLRIDKSGSVLVRSLDRSGTTREVASIAWPELGVEAQSAVIFVAGLQVTVPR